MSDGSWKRQGPPVMMVSINSASLNYPRETKIPCNADHSTIAKLKRGEDSPYSTIQWAIIAALPKPVRERAGIAIPQRREIIPLRGPSSRPEAPRKREVPLRRERSHHKAALKPLEIPHHTKNPKHQESPNNKETPPNKKTSKPRESLKPRDASHHRSKSNHSEALESRETSTPKPRDLPKSKPKPSSHNKSPSIKGSTPQSNHPLPPKSTSTFNQRPRTHRSPTPLRNPSQQHLDPRPNGETSKRKEAPSHK